MGDLRRTTTEPGRDERFPVPLRGVAVDTETRCTHWDTAVDVVALRFACCEFYYPCYQCHESTADHGTVQWPRERFDEPAVFCGVCFETFTPRAYLDSADSCPECGASFNPGCRDHLDLYFETVGE
jgi:uncharacterized CHY-type Zn-finger protein